MNKLIKTYFRYKKAKQLGFFFSRIKNFKLPREIIVNGCKVNLNYPSEEGVFNDFVSIFLDDVYGLDYFRNYDIKNIVDVGANIGLFAMAAKIVFPYSEIHAYEPNQNLTRFLNFNSSSLKFKNFCEAIGAESRLVKLELLGDSNQTRVEFCDSGNIHMISLKKALSRFDGQVDLLKMDCEGAEWDILEDKDTLSAVCNISIEYHLWKNKRSHEFSKEIVKSNGFRIIRQIPSTNFGIIVGTRN